MSFLPLPGILRGCCNGGLKTLTKRALGQVACTKRTNIAQGSSGGGAAPPRPSANAICSRASGRERVGKPKGPLGWQDTGKTIMALTGSAAPVGGLGGPQPDPRVTTPRAAQAPETRGCGAPAARGLELAAHLPPESPSAVPRGARWAGFPPGPENRSGRSPASGERVHPASNRGAGGRDGGGGEPGGERAAQGNNTSLFGARDPTHMTGPAAPRVARGSGPSSRSPPGASGSPAGTRPTRASEPRHRPPSRPGPGFHGSQLRVPGGRNPRSESPPRPLPPRGGPPAPERWGGYKGGEVTEKGRGATGPTLKGASPEPPVSASFPPPPRSLPRGPRTSTLS